MHHVVWLLKWLLKVAIFFTLFAFALNNQHGVSLHLFFDRQWTTPLILVILSAFALGLVLGVLSMVPRWWKQKNSATQARSIAASALAPHEKPAVLTPPDGL